MQVILALEILHALVQLLEAHLQPRLSPLMQSLMTKLGDHKVLVDSFDVPVAHSRLHVPWKVALLCRISADEQDGNNS